MGKFSKQLIRHLVRSSSHAEVQLLLSLWQFWCSVRSHLRSGCFLGVQVEVLGSGSCSSARMCAQNTFHPTALCAPSTFLSQPALLPDLSALMPLGTWLWKRYEKQSTRRQCQRCQLFLLLMIVLF